MVNEIEQDNLSFGIQDTMQMGIGSQELLGDLVAPETSTSNPDDIKDINEETDEEKASKKAAIKDKADTDKIAADKLAGKSDAPDNSLGNFLTEEEEEEEEESDEEKLKIKKKLGEATSEDVLAAEEAAASKETVEGGTQFEALSNDLFELGIFSKEEGEEIEPIKTAESFLERFESEKKKGAMTMVDNFIGQFGQSHQDAFDAIYVKGMDPEEYFKASAEITDFSKLDLTKESNQEKVIRQTLSEQDYEPEDIDSEIERLKNYGDLENVSQKHHKVLIKKHTKRLEQKTAEASKTRQHTANIKQEYISNVNKILQTKIKEKGFDGIPLSPKIANELQDFLLVDKWKTDSGETLTDFDKYILELKRPENHETKVKVGLLLKLLEKDPTLSTIQKRGISKKSDKLFREVSRQVSSTISNNKTSGEKSWFK